MKTRRQRDVHIKQLEIAKGRSKHKTDLIWTPQRLEKCPHGMSTLADRGFSECAVFYPHLNAVITPSFIDGRLQFTVEEVMSDRPKCESRYSSEAYFKRVWDSEFVTDNTKNEVGYHGAAYQLDRRKAAPYKRKSPVNTSVIVHYQRQGQKLEWTAAYRPRMTIKAAHHSNCSSC